MDRFCLKRKHLNEQKPDPSSHGYFETLGLSLKKNEHSIFLTESPRGLVANVLDCDIIVREIELQSRYWFFLDNSHGERDGK